MIPELPEPYKTRMHNAVLAMQEQAHIAMDIVHEFGSDLVEFTDGDVRVVIQPNSAEPRTT